MKDIKFINRKLFLFLLFLLCYSNVEAQTEKLEYEHLANNNVSPDGRYITYYKNRNQNNLLVLFDVKTGKEIILSDINQNTFLSDSCFMGIDKIKSVFYCVRLPQFKLETFDKVSEWMWLNNDEVLMYSKEYLKLTVLNIKSNKEIAFNQVSAFSINASKDKVVVKNKESHYQIIGLKNPYKKQELKSDYIFTHEKFIWNDRLDIPFVVGADDTDVYVIRLNGSKAVKVLQQPLFLDNGNSRVDTLFTDLQFVSDSKIALGLKSNKDKKSSEEGFEVWLGSEGGLTPDKHQILAYKSQLGLLDLKNDKLISFFNHKTPLVFKIDSYDNSIYEIDEFKHQNYKEYTQNVEISKYDSLYSKNFVAQSKLSAAHFYNIGSLPFFLNFKDKKWHMIDKKTQVVRQINNGSDIDFYEKDNIYSLVREMPVKQHFVLNRNKELIFRDRSDLFVFDYKENNLKKLTNYGADGKQAYLDNSNLKELPQTFWSFNFEKELRPYKDWIVTWNTDNYVWSGIDLLTADKKKVQLVKDKAYYTQLKRSKDVITYLKQKGNQPTALYRFDIRTKKEQQIYQSNIWDTLSTKTTYEYVEWNDEKDPGSKRGALIRYPKDYDKNKDYPVIVNIYEKMDYNQHHYNSPFVVSGMGFNVHHYTNDGYLIIQPDIKYEMGKTGKSATEYVLSAMEYLSDKLPIDKENIGLIGHSFGGYETNFVITQTPFFKAAVASAGISDIISFNHNMNWNTKQPDNWRMETDQFRMGKPFTDMPFEYLKNSPITHVGNITTPLLIWAGKEDFHANWHQSVEMFLAMKRLNKEVNLILYEGVNHTLPNDKVGEGASARVKQWFDYKLKNKEKPKWLD